MIPDFRTIKAKPLAFVRRAWARGRRRMGRSRRVELDLFTAAALGHWRNAGRPRTRTLAGIGMAALLGCWVIGLGLQIIAVAPWFFSLVALLVALDRAERAGQLRRGSRLERIVRVLLRRAAASWRRRGAPATLAGPLAVSVMALGLLAAVGIGGYVIRLLAAAAFAALGWAPGLLLVIVAVGWHLSDERAATPTP